MPQETPSRTVTTMRLPDELLTALAARAARLGISRTELCRRVLFAYLAQPGANAPAVQNIAKAAAQAEDPFA